MTTVNNFGWAKIIVSCLVTLALAFGSVALATGSYKEKVDNLEYRIEKAERQFSNDHDLLITNTAVLKSIDKRLTNIESILKEIQSKK